jgi:photosystem II stability/assembly factor-like uncharacterized protein
MDELIKAVLAAPVANLFIVGGLVFLGIAVVGQISGKIEPGKTGRIASGVLGAILLVVGLVIHLRPMPAPSSVPVSLEATPVSPTNTPAPPEATPVPPTNTPAPPEATPVPPTVSVTGESSLPAGSWQPVPDLPRQINVLAVDPTDPQVLYAGTGIYGSGGGGVYKSEDGGLTWRLAVNGLPNEVVKTLAFSQDVPPTLYTNVGPRGDIYASTDGAESWTYVGLNSELCCNFDRQMSISPSDGNVLFVVEPPRGVSRSHDGGQNWLPVKDERGEIRALSLAIDPADANVVYLGTEGNGVYKSTDGGETWSLANRGMLDYRITALAVATAQPQTVYAGGYGGELFKSTDGGQSWNDLTDKLPHQKRPHQSIRDIAIDPAAPDTVCLLVEWVGALVSYDGGARWRLLGKPGEVNSPSFTAMVTVFDPQLLLVVGIKDAGGWRYAAAQP